MAPDLPGCVPDGAADASEGLHDSEVEALAATTARTIRELAGMGVDGMHA